MAALVCWTMSSSQSTKHWWTNCMWDGWGRQANEITETCMD